MRLDLSQRFRPISRPEAVVSSVCGRCEPPQENSAGITLPASEPLSYLPTVRVVARFADQSAGIETVKGRRFFTSCLNAIEGLEGMTRVSALISSCLSDVATRPVCAPDPVDDRILPHLNQCFTRACDGFARLLEIVERFFCFWCQFVATIGTRVPIVRRV